MRARYTVANSPWQFSAADGLLKEARVGRRGTPYSTPGATRCLARGVNLRYYVEITDRPNLSAPVRFEQALDGSQRRRCIPPEDARVFTRIEPHGQAEQRSVRDARYGLENALAGHRHRVHRREGPCPARRPSGYRHAPRSPREVTHLHVLSCCHSASQAAWTLTIWPVR